MSGSSFPFQQVDVFSAVPFKGNPVAVVLDADRLFLALPTPALRDLVAPRLSGLAAALGLGADSVRASAIIDVGVAWITLQLADASLVRGLRLDQARIHALTPPGIVGVTVFGLASPGTQPEIEVRSFAPAEGVPEDPVCGSGNGCVAALVRRERLIARSTYIAGQGSCVGRDGRVEVRFGDDETIWLGGHAVTCVEGTLRTQVPRAWLPGGSPGRVRPVNR